MWWPRSQESHNSIWRRNILVDTVKLLDRLIDKLFDKLIDKLIDKLTDR